MKRVFIVALLLVGAFYADEAYRSFLVRQSEKTAQSQLADCELSAQTDAAKEKCLREQKNYSQEVILDIEKDQFTLRNSAVGLVLLGVFLFILFKVILK